MLKKGVPWSIAEGMVISMKRPEIGIKLSIIISGCLLLFSIVVPIIIVVCFNVNINTAEMIMGILFCMGIFSCIIMTILIAKAPSALNRSKYNKIKIYANSMIEFVEKLQDVLQDDYIYSKVYLEDGDLRIFFQEASVFNVVCILTFDICTNDIIDVANQKYCDFISPLVHNKKVNVTTIVVTEGKIKKQKLYLKEGNTQQLKGGRLFALVDLNTKVLTYEKSIDSLFKRKQRALEKQLIGLLNKANLVDIK